MITIRFVTCDDAVSNGIRKYEYGYWATHAEALMPDGTLLGAHADGGVLARSHDYDANKFTREEYVSIRATPEQTDSFHSFLRSQLGKPYDFAAIEAFAASPIVGERDWQSPDSWFCSELQAAALSHCGVFPPRLATEFNHITPRDLLLIVSGRFDVAA
jgi:hypothetical protein